MKVAKGWGNRPTSLVDRPGQADVLEDPDEA